MENSFAEKDLGVLVDNKVNISQQCAPAAMKVNDILIWIRQNIGSRCKDKILPLYSALVRSHLKCYVQFCAPQNEREVYSLERIQWRTVNVIKELNI